MVTVSIGNVRLLYDRYRYVCIPPLRVRRCAVLIRGCAVEGINGKVTANKGTGPAFGKTYVSELRLQSCRTISTVLLGTCTKPANARYFPNVLL